MNKKTKIYTFLVVSVSLLGVNSAAMSAEEDKKNCIKPRFYMFSPENRAHVDPGAEITFRATGVTDATTVEMNVKRIDVPLQLEDRNIFYIFKGKVPEELAGQAARVRISGLSKQVNGGCLHRDGWLLLVNETASAAASDASGDAEASGETGQAPAADGGSAKSGNGVPAN
ncbi:MAG: hypothetical protein ACU826_09010 [Gammaproteobacteria bacterium]